MGFLLFKKEVIRGYKPLSGPTEELQTHIFKSTGVVLALMSRLSNFLYVNV